MIHIDRPLKLCNLEVFRYFQQNKMLAYVIIEDTRAPYTAKHRKLEPLCFLDEDYLQLITNAFRIYIVHDEMLQQEQSLMLRDFFGQLFNNHAQTNYIVQEYVYPKLYEEETGIELYQKMLQFVGSAYEIAPITDKQWTYLTQEGQRVKKIRAMYIGDIRFDQCPVFELNEETNYFEMLIDKEFRYEKGVIV